MAYLDFFFSFSFHFFLLSSSKNPLSKIGWRPKIASPSSIRSKLLLHQIRMSDVACPSSTSRKLLLLHLIRMFDVAYPNSKLQKQGGQRRTRDTGQIRHRHAHCFLERKLRQMVLLREPTLHNSNCTRKERSWMAKLSTTRFTSEPGCLQGLRLITNSKFCGLVRNNEALLGQAVGEKLDANIYGMSKPPEGGRGRQIHFLCSHAREGTLEHCCNCHHISSNCG